MSTHAVNIISIDNLTPHSNADKLQLTLIGGWQCVIGKDVKLDDKMVYVEPDYVVNTDHPSFAFLKSNVIGAKPTKRITVRRFRGEISQGLLVPVPSELADLPVGTNVIEQLGITRYEPPEEISMGGNIKSGPSLQYAPKFDVESYQRYTDHIVENEEVIATEKIHGANARFVWAKNPDTGEYEQYCGSRTNWLKDETNDIWWKIFHTTPAIGSWCKANPDVILYGEVFGQVQNLKYGIPNGLAFAAFAMLDKGIWISYDDMVASLDEYGVPKAPFVYRGPFNKELLYKLAEENSRWPTATDQLSEGIVITPVKERVDHKLGRCVLKIVSNRYLEM